MADGAYSGEWPLLEYDDSYPVEEANAGWLDGLPLDLGKAARWLVAVLPDAAENMPCFCDVSDTLTEWTDRPAKLIEFSTGGWSGAETIIGVIQGRFDLKHYMMSWKRGGHYVFEVPLANLASTPSPRSQAGLPQAGGVA